MYLFLALNPISLIGIKSKVPKEKQSIKRKVNVSKGNVAISPKELEEMSTRNGSVQSKFSELSRTILEVVIVVIRVILIYIETVYNAIMGKRLKSVKEKVVVVTGGGHGLGRELAMKLSLRGAKIALIDINTKNNESVEKEIISTGHDAIAYTCDVTKEEDVRRVMERVKTDLGQIDILINNAGIVQCLPITELKSSMIEKTFQVNVYSHFWTIRSVLPDMIARGAGHIVAISSIAGLLGTPNCVDYW